MHKSGKRTPPERRKLIAAVHVQAKNMGMDTATRRNLQQQVTGKDSCAVMTDAELQRLLTVMKQPNQSSDKPVFRPQGDARARKVAAMWQQLFQEGAINNGSPQALNSFVQRQVGIAALNWVKKNADYDALIFGLRGIAQRAGVRLNG